MYPEMAKHREEDPLSYLGMIRARFATEMIATCDLVSIQ